MGLKGYLDETVALGSIFKSIKDLLGTFFNFRLSQEVPCSGEDFRANTVASKSTWTRVLDPLLSRSTERTEFGVTPETSKIIAPLYVFYIISEIKNPGDIDLIIWNMI